MISKLEFDDMFELLTEAHGWKISPQTKEAFYDAIKSAELDDLQSAFTGALTAAERMWPQQFISAVRQSIVQRARSGKTVKALPAGQYEACPDGLARLNRLVGMIKESDGKWKCSDAQFRKLWAEPLTDDEMMRSQGKTLGTLLQVVGG